MKIASTVLMGNSKDILKEKILSWAKHYQVKVKIHLSEHLSQWQHSPHDN